MLSWSQRGQRILASIRVVLTVTNIAKDSAGYHSHRQEPIGGLVEIGGDVNGDLAETRDPGLGEG